MKGTAYFGGKKFELEDLGEGRVRITRDGTNYSVTTTEQAIMKWQGGAYIQNAMPELSPDQREFLISGLDPEQWESMFGPAGELELE